MYEVWVYIIALLVAIPSAILGSFLLLKRSVMVSDAISHAVLPGLVIGFLIAKSLYSPILLFFASIFGVITIVVIEWIYKNSQVKKEAAIGVSYTFLFALGVLLIANFTSENTDLHQDCILYGNINSAPYFIVEIGNLVLGPKAVWILGGLNIMIIVVVFFGWRALNVTSFDPIFAKSIGINPVVWNYILMILVSVCVVTAFDIIGAILIISLLAAPAASAFLFAKRSHSFLLLAIGIALINTLLSIFISFNWNLEPSGTLALFQGVTFLLLIIVQSVFRYAK